MEVNFNFLHNIGVFLSFFDRDIRSLKSLYSKKYSQDNNENLGNFSNQVSLENDSLTFNFLSLLIF